jgi:hypothetical protein
MSVKRVPHQKLNFHYNEQISESALVVASWYWLRGGRAAIRLCEDGVPVVVAVSMKGWTGKVKTE